MPLLAVVLVAALVRVWVALDATDAPFWSVPIVDEIAYMQMSERMVLGQEPPYGAYYMTPGYAWFLAALVGLGAQLPAVKIVQLVLGVVNAVLVFALGRRWFDARVGVVAGVLWAVAPTVLLHEILILKPTLTVFLAFAALWIVARDGAGVVAWTLGGLLLGAAATVRGEMLVVGLGLVVGALLAARREFPPAPRPGWAPVLGLLALLAVVAVPTAQNLARGGGFVVIAYSGGPNFYIGNHDGADGSYLPLRPGRSDATVEEDDAVRLAREESPLALDAAGVSRFWWRQGLEWWAREPLEAVSVTLKKAVLLWGAWEGNDVHSLPIAGRWIAALNNPVVRPWLIFPLALAGLVFLRPWRGRWPLVVFLLGSWIALVPFFVFERFRLPMMAVAGCFAKGTTRLVNVGQARIKETDRIAVMAAELSKMGATVRELEDGLEIEQSDLHGAQVHGHADHRVVMALAVAATAARGSTRLTTAEAASVTFPTFVERLRELGAAVEAE
jgi:hypothetical protein